MAPRNSELGRQIGRQIPLDRVESLKEMISLRDYNAAVDEVLAIKEEIDRSLDALLDVMWQGEFTFEDILHELRATIPERATANR